MSYRDHNDSFRRAQLMYDAQEAPFVGLCHHCERELEPDEEMHEGLCPECWEAAQRDHDDEIDRQIDEKRFGGD